MRHIDLRRAPRTFIHISNGSALDGIYRVESVLHFLNAIVCVDVSGRRHSFYLERLQSLDQKQCVLLSGAAARLLSMIFPKTECVGRAARRNIKRVIRQILSERNTECIPSQSLTYPHTTPFTTSVKFHAE